MPIELIYFLFGYLIFLGFFLLFTLINLYLIIRFGFASFSAWAATFLFVGATLVVIFLTYFYATEIDWRQTINFFDSASNNFINY
jgi:hypothetical protein